MAQYKVGYLIGSLSSKSINRKLATALTLLAPVNRSFTITDDGKITVESTEKFLMRLHA